MSTRSMLNVVQTSFHYTKERHMELEERALNDVNYQTFIALLNAQLENLQQHSFYDKDKFKVCTVHTAASCFITNHNDRMRKSMRSSWTWRRNALKELFVL